MVFYNEIIDMEETAMEKKVDKNKQKKRESLLESAFSLFIMNGFNKTSIADIVNRAGVAKGTFYLYFKDKYDIRNHLIAHKANQTFQNAYLELRAHPEITDFEQQILLIIDRILEQLAANHSLVLFLSKHLSWGFIRNSLVYNSTKDLTSIYEIFEEMLANAGCSYRSPELMMYLILEIVSGASYSVILYGQPVTLEQLKPELYETVKGIFKQYRIA